MATRWGTQPVSDILYEQRWSIARVAREIGVKKAHLYCAVSGVTTPSPQVRERLPKFLNRPLEDLFNAEVLERKFWHANGGLK